MEEQYEKLYIDENTTIGDVLDKYFKCRFDDDYILGTISWFCTDGAYVEENFLIGWLTLDGFSYVYNKSVEIKIELHAVKSGFINIQFLFSKNIQNLLSKYIIGRTINFNSDDFQKTDLFFTIEKNEIDFIEKYSDFYNYRIFNDEFTGEKKLEWENSNYSVINIDGKIVQLKSINNDDCLLIRTDEKYDIGTSFSFLFTDGFIKSFSFSEKPLKIEKKYSVKLMLYEDDLITFSTKDIKSCRVFFSNGEFRHFFSVPEPKWHNGRKFNRDIKWRDEDDNFYFRLFFISYMKAMKEVHTDWKPKQSPSNNKRPDAEFIGINESEQVCVYLMIDYNTNYHKIGISNNPKFREHTLQSEKPTIEMLCCKSFPNRKMAQAIESALHSAYSDKRVRGEWFELNERDVIDVIHTLQ